MVGADRPGYPGDKGRAYSSGREGRRRVQKSRREKESRVGEDVGEGIIWWINWRRFGRGRSGWVYKAAHKPLGVVPNAPLASATGKNIHLPTLSILEIHGGLVKREREMSV